MLIRTTAGLETWQRGAAEAFGDPADAVCLLAFEWVADPARYTGDRLACGLTPEDVFCLRLGEDTVMPLDVARGSWRVGPIGVEQFGADELGPGVWALSPSLNMPEILHAFVILHGVPDPAPWPAAAGEGGQDLAAEQPRLWRPGEP